MYSQKLNLIQFGQGRMDEPNVSDVEKFAEDKEDPAAEETDEEENETLEQDILRELMCPICGVYMEPPIYQCTIGHNFCKECFVLITYCPKCYSPKGATRNQLLEKMYYKVNLPCKYARNGCEFKCKKHLLDAHEAECTYTIRKCPFNLTSLCSWNGIIYDIEEHCNDLHGIHVHSGPEYSRAFFNFDEYFDAYYMYMLFAYNSLFRFTAFIDKSSRMMKFAATYLGKQLAVSRYVYQVKFLRHGTQKPAITLKATCEYLSDHTKPFSGQNYMCMPLDVLKPFCDSQGDLHYEVKIIDNGESAADCQASTSKASF